MKEDTRVVRAGLPEPEPGDPFLPGPTFAAPFHLPGDPEEAEFDYGRHDNPSWRGLELALAELEGGPVVLFASGMAACAAVLLTRLGPDSVLALPSDCYMGVRRLAQGHLAERGVRIHAAPTATLLAELPDQLDVLWLETPSNPGLDICDLRDAAGLGHERGALVVADNSLATPLGQSPLTLGLDVSVTSATKQVAGHADLVLGYVAAADDEQAKRLRRWRIETGAVPGPFEAWLAHRSLATLALRVERSCGNALALARTLAGRDDLSALRYPGLEADPAHELARSQMRRFGSVLCFDLGSRERAERFLAEARLVTRATSFGGIHTSGERRARWHGDDVPEGFVRLSAGCEDPDDLVEDIARALGASA